MSAYLDKSQKVTFMFANIFALHSTAKNSKLDSPFITEQARVIKGSQAIVEEFKPKELQPAVNERPFSVPAGVREAEEMAKRRSIHPIANLQKNLNELTDAHEKLRFLLQELESLTKKKS